MIKGRVIPDNATNRTVLQIVFPSLFKVFSHCASEVKGNITLRYKGFLQKTKAKWLDAPYEDKENE